MTQSKLDREIADMESKARQVLVGRGWSAGQARRFVGLLRVLIEAVSVQNRQIDARGKQI